jgi:hypothetical protein
LHVELLVVAGLQFDSLTLDGFETAGAYRDAVAAGNQELHDPTALPVRFGCCFDVGFFGCDGDVRPRNHSALSVSNAAVQRGARALAPGR